MHTVGLHREMMLFEMHFQVEFLTSKLNKYIIENSCEPMKRGEGGERRPVQKHTHIYICTHTPYTHSRRGNESV